MSIFLVMSLGLFSGKRRSVTAAEDLDVALAGAQIALEKKRQRWLLFLVQKEEHCLSLLAQTDDVSAGAPTHDEEHAADN